MDKAENRYNVTRSFKQSCIFRNSDLCGAVGLKVGEKEKFQETVTFPH